MTSSGVNRLKPLASHTPISTLSSVICRAGNSNFQQRSSVKTSKPLGICIQAAAFQKQIIFSSFSYAMSQAGMTKMATKCLNFLPGPRSPPSGSGWPCGRRPPAPASRRTFKFVQHFRFSIQNFWIKGFSPLFKEGLPVDVVLAHRCGLPRKIRS